MEVGMRLDGGQDRTEPYGELVHVASHWCRTTDSLVYCEQYECPRCGEGAE